MLDKEEAKEKIKELIEQFSGIAKNKDYFNEYNEENTKWQFIEPLLTAVLSWQREDIVKEQRILK